ncbi:TPA: hypothetical protein ACF3TU_000568 [Enterococcus faecium]|nr:hypothetical protein [Enterococcus faecium]
MDYDALIGELYDVCHEYENHMSDENEQDLEFLRRLYNLNFEVRKNGVKGLGEPETIVMDDDVRIAFNTIISDLTQLSEEVRFPSIRLHLDEIRGDLLSDGIDGLKPY